MTVYQYTWRNNEKRRTLAGRCCLVLVRGRANSALVEFENGQREVVSRNALQRFDRVRKRALKTNHRRGL